MKKFTLVELLVVIAIIGLLASLLVPVLGKAREQARKAVCSSNQKQIGVSISMYAGDHNFDAPLAGGANGYSSWDDFLASYDGRDSISLDRHTFDPSLEGESYGDVYRCPTDDILNDYGGTKPLGRSYSMTKKTVYGSPPIYNERRWSLGMGHISLPRNFADLNKPSATILIFDYHDSSNNLGNKREDTVLPMDFDDKDQLGLTAHNSKANFLMTDGHVESLGLFKTLITSDGTMATTGNVSDTIWDASSDRN